jgi:hypothetical protein
MDYPSLPTLHQKNAASKIKAAYSSTAIFRINNKMILPYKVTHRFRGLLYLRMRFSGI